VRAAAVLTALLALAGPAVPARAQTDLPELPPAGGAPGWTRQGDSLLLYDSSGSLTHELPLREGSPEGSKEHETVGGISPDGRLAWTLDRTRVWTRGRGKLLESRRLLSVYGADGARLWRDEDADIPERGAPVLISADGQTLLIARREDDGWSAQARSWTGAPIRTLGPFPRLVMLALTPNGRYALARWRVPEKSDTHTFVDLKTGARKDVASSDLLLGLARVDDDGVVRSGPRVVFSFDASASTAAVSASTAAAPGAP
jgi:hypothetical protein